MDGWMKNQVSKKYYYERTYFCQGYDGSLRAQLVLHGANILAEVLGVGAVHYQGASHNVTQPEERDGLYWGELKSISVKLVFLRVFTVIKSDSELSGKYWLRSKSFSKM